jgi:hypothetical protein
MNKLFFILLSVFALTSCSSDNDSSTSGDDYNRTELLTNWADNLIIPRLTNYQTKVATLQASTTTFTTTPDQTNLDALRTAWLEAYKAYQYVGSFNIGKAEEINLNTATNTYPTSATGITTNITNGGYNFALLSQYDKQGFPALDYMLNGLATTDAEIIDFYVTNGNAAGYKQYLTDLSNTLKSNIDLVVTDWNTSYRATYIASNGNAISSSVNKTINSFVKYYEKDIRAGKIGIAAGIFSTGTTFPEKVEAYYKNDASKELLNESIIATKDFFNGKHFNSATVGVSLKSYLDYLNAVRDGQKLSDIINNQFATINSTNALLSNSFSNQVTTNNPAMLASYDELQRLVVNFKLDMMTAFNITVDYVDADGD